MKRERPDVVVAVGGATPRRSASGIFEQYPFVDVAFGPGSIPHLGDWIAAGGYASRAGGSARTSTSPPICPHTRAPLPGLGAGVDGLQLEVRVLHRPVGAWREQSRRRARSSPR
jgi:hypothetical protein